MRILAITSVYPRHQEDAEVPWFRESVRRLVAAGHEVEILAPSWKGLSSHRIDGVPVHRFRYAPRSMEYLTGDEGAASKTRQKPWLQLLAIPYIALGFLACWRLCRKGRYDLVHVHWPFPHGIIAQAARLRSGLPVVLSFYGAELLLANRHPWIRPVLRRLLGQAEATLCISRFTSSQVLALREVPVEISPYGNTLPESNAPPRRARRPEDPFRILFVGRHIERKGIEHLIDAMARLPGDRFHLDIVGHGDRTESLKERARATGDSRIRFLGKVSSEDLSRAYAESDVFVLPAVVDSKGDTEGLGVVLIEATEMGLPVVGSDVGGIPDVVVHERTGLLVKPGDPQALADALLRLADDPQLSERLVAGGRRHAREHFAWDVVIPHLESVYRRVVSGKG